FRRHVGEPDTLPIPARQSLEIGFYPVTAAIERRVRAVKQRVLRIEKGERVGVELCERRRPFCDDARCYVVGRASHEAHPFPPTSFEKVSGRPRVRLNTGRSAVESGSRTK